MCTEMFSCEKVWRTYVQTLNVTFWISMKTVMMKILLCKIFELMYKTEIIHFHKIDDKIPSTLKIKMNEKLSYPSDHIKYLGIYVDETLKRQVSLMN